MPLKPNAMYNLAAPGTVPVRIIGAMRRRMFQRFLAASGIGSGECLLDVGATSDQGYDSSNYVEAWYPYKHRVVACGIDDAGFLPQQNPGMRFLRADGLALPFADGSFDHVHASAVIEHVGSRSRQRQFLHELYRVCRKSLFITTPNRWYPIEFHTLLPLVHWLPAAQFRWLLRHTGRTFFAEESNLNLLDRRALAALAVAAGLAAFDVGSVRLLGFSSNLILVARKAP